MSKAKKEYMKYIQKKLKKYKVDTPSEIPDKKKRKFFKEVDKGWKSKEEKKDKKKKEGEDKELWVKNVQEEVKEKQKGEKPAKPVVKIEKEGSLEGFSKDWEKTLNRIVKAIVSNLARNNSSGVKSQIDLLKQSCADLEALLEDFRDKKSHIVSAVREIIAYKPPEGLFKEPGTQIAKQLLADAKSAGQAMQRLNFYINRAGSNLSEADMKRLNAAKKIISEAVAKGKEAVIKMAPGRPPKGWWDKMVKQVKKNSPEYTPEVVDKVVGDLWYNKMKGPKKKEVMKEYEK